MKVILQQDVKGTGKKDQVPEVSDGFARNFLLPKGLAKEATAANINAIKLKKDAAAHKKQMEKEQAMAQAAALRGKTVTVKGKAGEGERLFGAITNKEVAEAIARQLGVAIDKKNVVMDTIKTIATTSAELKLFPEIAVTITVKVEKA